ncbi:MFS transporter [Pseudonocardia sp. H11422]|uniref:MFS transporter n=1 Tax=Pseudonocardia sp. H11422 TaxID=2835866 RepID=UPI001BDC90E4|nr:MFS transporter [Pseudonocardia sp. H11422]
MPTYLEVVVGLGPTTALLSVLGMMLVVPVGALSDRSGRKPLLVTPCVGFILLSYPALLLMIRGSIITVVLGLMILGLLLVMLLGTMSATLPALFDTKVRYGGFSIGYNLSRSIFGGTAPLILTFLVEETGNATVPGLYIALAALISLGPVLRIRESARRPLEGAAPTVLRAGPPTT